MHMHGIRIGRHGGRNSVVGVVHLVMNVAHSSVNDVIDGAAGCVQGFVALAHIVKLRGRAKETIGVFLSCPSSTLYSVKK